MNVVYNIFKKEVFDNSIDVLNDTIKVILVSASYNPDESESYYSDITDEIDGTTIGYTTGGIELTGKGITEVSSTSSGTFTADSPVWVSSTITDARGAVIYKVGASTTDSTLITYIDFGSNKSSSSGNFSIQWNSAGIMRLT